MPILTKDAILNAQDRQIEKVPVPEWGGEVCVRSLSGAERDAFEAGCSDGKGRMTLDNFRARLLVRAVCDENGAPLFNPKGEDLIRLGQKSAKAMDRVFAKAKELSGFSKDDIEEYVKNSESDPTSASATA